MWILGFQVGNWDHRLKHLYYLLFRMHFLSQSWKAGNNIVTYGEQGTWGKNMKRLRTTVLEHLSNRIILLSLIGLEHEAQSFVW